MTKEISNNKRIAKNTLMLYVRTFVTLIVSLYTSRIVLKALGVEDFGIYNVVGGMVSMLAFVNGALSTATSRFITFELGRKNNTDNLKRIFKTSITIHFLLAIIVVFIAETIGSYFLNYRLTIPNDKMFSANVIFQISLISTFIGIVQAPLNALIISHEDMKVYAYIGILDVVIKLAIAFIIDQYLDNRLILYGVLILSSTLINFTIYNIYCYKSYVIYTIGLLYDKSLFRKILSFSLWSLFGSLAYTLKGQGLNMILNIFQGPIINAAWGVANQVNAAVSSFTQNFTLALNPQIIKSYADNKTSVTTNLLISGSKFSCYLMLLFAIPIIIQAEHILNIWLVDVPNYAVIFTQLVLINSILESYTHTIGATIQATGNIKKYQVIVGGILLLNMPISYVFLKLGNEPYFVMLISIVLTVISLIVRTSIISKYLNVSKKYFYTHVFIKPILIGLTTFFLAIQISKLVQPVFLHIIITILISSISTIFLIVLIGINTNERLILKNKLYKVINNKL